MKSFYSLPGHWIFAPSVAHSVEIGVPGAQLRLARSRSDVWDMRSDAPGDDGVDSVRDTFHAGLARSGPTAVGELRRLIGG